MDCFQPSTFSSPRKSSPQGHPTAPRTIGYVENEGWIRNPEDSPYTKHIAQVVQHSPKILQIQEIINTLENYPDTEVPEKLVVVLFDPFSAFLVYLVS